MFFIYYFIAMDVNVQLWKFYDKQPWDFFRWWIYSSQKYCIDNINKTMCPSSKTSEVFDNNKEICKDYLLHAMGMVPPSYEYKKHVIQEDWQ